MQLYYRGTATFGHGCNSIAEQYSCVYEFTFLHIARRSHSYTVSESSRVSSEEVMSLTFSEVQTMRVVDEIHKGRDKNRPRQRFNPSEIAWQSFLLEAEQDGVLHSRLRCIVISHVINDNTRDTIFETTRASTTLPSGDHAHQYNTRDQR